VFPFLTQGIVLGLYAAVLPGPFQALLLSQILKNGWKRTLPLGLIPLVTDGPVMLTLFLLLAQLPDWFTVGLRIFGGLFILYLAWDAFRSSKETTGSTAAQDENPTRKSGFLKGFTMNLLNPNVYIFWGTIGVPTILSGWEIKPAYGMAFIIGFYLTMLPMILLWIVLFGRLGQLKSAFKTNLARIIVLLLCIVGLSMLYNGVKALLVLSSL
jgi:threonine/homoserine/homoserine lactone efflux protein